MSSTRSVRPLFAACLLGFAAAGAFAQAADAPAPDAGAAPFPPAPAATGWPVTANIALTSNYISRGFTQTWGHAALQGGFDYANPNGLYLGTWLSSLSGTEYKGGTVEWDLYGGYTGTVGPLGYVVGAYYYAYPGTSSPLIGGHKYDYAEIKLGASYKFASLNYYYTATQDWFGTVNDGRGSGYVDLSVNPDLGNGYTLLLHYGDGWIAHHAEANWQDWKVGVSKAFDGGWTLTGAYTEAKDKNGYWTGLDFKNDPNGAPSDMRLGKAAFVVTISKTF
jgi:uncharacterized protein (TIGR02001 family)